jgi:hypothetical protein
MIWKMLMFAETEAKFKHIWQWILDEFKEQDDLLDYVLTSWFPWKEQWAEYLVNSVSTSASASHPRRRRRTLTSRAI